MYLKVYGTYWTNSTVIAIRNRYEINTKYEIDTKSIRNTKSMQNPYEIDTKSIRNRYEINTRKRNRHEINRERHELISNKRFHNGSDNVYTHGSLFGDTHRSLITCLLRSGQFPDKRKA